MRQNADSKLIQIIPANANWHAVYKDKDAPDEEWWSPITMWGLFERGDGEFNYIDGIDMHGEGAYGFDGCSEASNFIRFDV